MRVLLHNPLFWYYLPRFGSVAVLLLSLLFISLGAYAQREADNWYFGDGAGLNFSNGYPVPLTNSAMGRTVGSAVMSNPSTGNLMFYTNAEQIWNKKHEVMSNGDSLNGSSGIYQSALIIPVPTNKQKFYVFTLAEADSFENVYANLSYSVIDMQLDNGFGSVVDTAKNIFLADSLTEKLTAIPHRNQKDYWLIAHTMGDNCFQVFLINKKGISTPTQQCIGTAHGSTEFGMNIAHSYGFLKPSPDGKKLAVTTVSFEPRPLDLFSFNDSTGVISNYRNLGNFANQFGISFSPDNSKLYLYALHESDVESYNRNISLYQMDVSKEDQSFIRNSRVVLTWEPKASTYNIGALQIAPDGRIYGTYDVANLDVDDSFHVINYPNRKGNAANIEVLTFNFGEGEVTHWLPNFGQSFFNGLDAEDFPFVPEGTDPCTSENSISIFPNPTNDFIQLKIAESCYLPYTLTIYNALGQLISKFNVEKQTSDLIDVQNYSPGLYFADIKMSNRRIVKKFIKY